MLAGKLTDRGHQARFEDAQERLTTYERECGERYDAAQEAARKLAELEREVERVNGLAKGLADGLEQSEIEQQVSADVVFLTEECARADRAVQDMDQRLDVFNQEIAQAEAQGDPAIALAVGRDYLDRLHQLDEALADAQRLLRAASLHTLTSVRGGVKQELRSLLTAITDDLTLRIEVDEQLRPQLVGDLTSPGDIIRGPHSTVDESTVFTRVALGRVLAEGREPGPLLLDDVTSSADEQRIRRLLEQCAQLARFRQVVVFAHDPTTRDWAIDRSAIDRRVHLHLVQSVDAEVGYHQPPASAARLF